RMSGFLTLAQSQGEVERLFVEMVQAGIGDAHLEALFPGCTDGLDRAMLEKVELGERMVPEAVKWGIGVPRLMASNNWCVSGSWTASGAAMLSNDPHLETNRLPNVWVEQSFRWPDGYAILMTMPGLPAPLVGRTEHLSLRPARGNHQTEEGQADRRDVLGEPAWRARGFRRNGGISARNPLVRCGWRSPLDQRAAPDVDGADDERRDGCLRRRRVRVQLDFCRQRR
ncbi:MAG: penicillin acylase family protein, partial [Deltaproteobacteria bacterium]|nr:penicillin acylase family protein [Deltaproteobacteria bacterium]